jgi:hypothetical protein
VHRSCAADWCFMLTRTLIVVAAPASRRSAKGTASAQGDCWNSGFMFRNLPGDYAVDSHCGIWAGLATLHS